MRKINSVENRKRGVGYDQYRGIVLSYPNVEESIAYGCPIFNVKKKMMTRVLEDGQTVVVKIELPLRSSLIEGNPDAFYITDHYAAYPLMLVRLSEVEAADLKYLLEHAWIFVASPRTIKEFDKNAV